MVGGEAYDFVPLGKYVVRALGVCGGRPTFKYTRIEVAGVLELLGSGESMEKIVAGYKGRVPHEALQEAIEIVTKKFVDEAIPTLLSGESEPTFVTINETDFWRRVPLSNKFCVVCFTFSLERAGEIPASLQRLFRHPDFRTKAQRMGSVVRGTGANEASYYTVADRTVRAVENW